MPIIYEKADYAATYSEYACLPNGARLVDYKGPEFPGTLEGTSPPVTVRLHYHPSIQRPTALWRAGKVLERYNITSEDRVLVFGAGFGWLCEALEQLTGCRAYGVDLSQYVQDSGATSADDDLKASIESSGYSITSGYGKTIYDLLKDGNPRTSATVYQGDLRDSEFRQYLRDQEGGDPTYIITEEAWQLNDDSERGEYRIAMALDAWVGTVVHIIDGVII